MTTPIPTLLVGCRRPVGSKLEMTIIRSFVRALDIGGIVWEGLEHYSALDEALHALEHVRAEWMRTQGFE